MPKPLAFVVEDDPLLNNVFSLTLQPDYEIRSVADGERAIQELTQASPALIVLDMNLPGASGRDILAYIRTQKRLAQTRIIVATADALQADSLEDQVDLVLLKPVSPNQLRALTARIMKTKKIL
ncbi:MAG: response regulator [Anaerolineales bacterium]|jgi:CheY-like chemotaxis protein|nr:response regulator [Anaerolineales bacterium]